MGAKKKRRYLSFGRPSLVMAIRHLLKIKVLCQDNDSVRLVVFENKFVCSVCRRVGHGICVARSIPGKGAPADYLAPHRYRQRTVRISDAHISLYDGALFAVVRAPSKDSRYIKYRHTSANAHANFYKYITFVSPRQARASQ